MAALEASVHIWLLTFFIFSVIILKCDGLNCRSNEIRKEEELKNIFMNCLKRQERRNSSNRYHNSDSEWRDSQNSRKSYNRDSRDDRNGYREEYGSSNDRMGYRDDSYDGMDDSGHQGSRSDRMGGRSDNRGDRNRSRGKNDRNGGMDDMMGNHDRHGNKERAYGREDFQQSSEFGECQQDVSRYNNYRSQQRYKRRGGASDKNSGHRSQYNPNASRRGDNSSDDAAADRDAAAAPDNACALHCFLENMEMTGSDGMPDKYLTTHALTKDVTNEDLKDFLQESIEECFQILDNENMADRCAFSRGLLQCLADKGRANCDDWRDDAQVNVF